MNWLTYLFPQTLLIASSKYNREIRVNLEFNKPKLLVNGSRQSGEYIRKLWEVTFREFGIKNRNAKQILVLGLGGGTVIQLLTKVYPRAKITAVEIDKKMIDIALKYFRLGELKNLQIVKDDAEHFIKEIVLARGVPVKGKFNLIIIDLFSGRHIPEFVGSVKFLHNLQKTMIQDGTLIINYLRELEYQPKSNQLMNLLQKTFYQVQDFTIKCNRFFCARKGQIVVK